MDVMVNDIADLFGESEIASDKSGSLSSIAMLLEDCEPSLLLLADADGNVLVTKGVVTEAHQAPVRDLAFKLHAGLCEKSSCLLEVSFNAQPRFAFAVRLSAHAENGILGVVVRRCGESESRLHEIQKSLSVCGELAWIGFHENLDKTLFLTQLQQLTNEQYTLKDSHSRAVSQAIEEHERRLHEQQEGMARLERLHLKNEMILNSAGEGIFGTDCDGKISFVNPAGARMVGWEPEKLVGKSQHQLLHHTKRNGNPCGLDECMIQTTLRDGTIGFSDSEIFWRKNGSSFPVEYTSTPILEDGKIVGAVLTFRDVTERKALEQQLVQAQKLESIGHLAAGIAHEINTPTQYIGDNTRFLQDAFVDLNLVLGSFSRLLIASKNSAVTDDLIAEVQAVIEDAEMDYLAEEMSTAVEQSLEGVKRVATIVRSMKEFSHPGSDEKQAVDINRAIENTLTVTHNEWKYVAEAVTKLDPDLPHVSCLPGECNQVFLNLIINASHAIADKLDGRSIEKGIITLTTSHDADWAEIRVQDNGTGIPEAARSRIMDPFYTTKEVGRGTGQGLAIARSVIVDKHGGTLNFETECNKGTTFIIRLPIGQGS